MNRSILAAATAALLVSSIGAATAADIVTADPILAPVVERSWTGAYVGGFLGGTFEADGNSGQILFDTDLDGIFNEPGNFVPTGTGANAFAPGFCSGKPTSIAPAVACDDDDDGSFSGSVRVGYDYQYDNFVFGGLVDLQFMDIERTSTAFSVAASYSIQRELDFTAAGRVKLGYAASDSFMAYATGGVVFGDIDHSFTTTNGVNTFVLNDDDDNIGYQIGAGAEYRLTDNISLSLEYLYTSFGDDDTTVRAAGGPVGATFVANNPLGTDFRVADDEFDYHTVMVGVNYRF